MSKLKSFKTFNARKKRFCIHHYEIERNEEVKKSKWNYQWLAKHNERADRHINDLVRNEPHYTRSEIAARNSAKSNTSTLNEYLSKKVPSSDWHDSTLDTHTHLSNAIKKNTMAQDTHVYVGLGRRRNENVHHQLQLDDVVHIPHYLSTSLSKDQAKQFSTHIYPNADKGSNKDSYRTMLKIKIPKGAHAMPLQPGRYDNIHSERENLHFHSNGYDNEHEVMLHHGAKFRIHAGHHEIEHDGDKYKLFHATMIHDGVKSLE